MRQQIPVSSAQGRGAGGIAVGVPIAGEDSSFAGGLLAMEDWPQEDRSATAVAHVAEFVALPGKAAEIRSLIPAAIRQASPGSEGFAGSMVLFSEQEERLVTVITLWKKSDKRNHWIENSKRLEILVQPYVDRWLRTRKLAAVICPS